MCQATAWVLFTAPSGADADSRWPDPVTLAHGPSQVITSSQEGPRFLAGSAPEFPRQPSWLLEPVTVAGRPRLLILSPAGRPARLNGQPAPPVALADVKDELQFDGGPVLFLSRRHMPRVGPPPDDAVGRECPTCRGRLTADTVVYTCPGCGTLMHLEGEDRGDNRLECALLGSECLSCQAPIVLQQGYAWIPEF